MPRRLKLDLIEQKPKRVHIVSSWRDRAGLTADADVARILVHIRKCIENGSPLPTQYYRKGVDQTVDTLLQTEGIMHLHLKKSNSSELLFLVQYDDHVVFLELSDHTHFATRPVGTKLKFLHAAALAIKETELESTPKPQVGQSIMKRRFIKPPPAKN